MEPEADGRGDLEPDRPDLAQAQVWVAGSEPGITLFGDTQ